MLIIVILRPIFIVILRVIITFAAQSIALLSWGDIEPLASGFFYIPIMQRVIFYIDGFNFYYGLRRAKYADNRWLKAYWINVVKLCEQFLGEGQILEKVVYFTASPLNPDKSMRQSAFLNANKAISGPRFEVVRGKYLKKEIICPYCQGHISRPEEKRTDVNISVRMVGDAVLRKADIYALVSADSDLLTPINYIRQNFKDTIVKVYFPPSNFSHDIRDTLSAWGKKPVLMIKSFYLFDRAHLADAVEGDGERFICPDNWK